MRNIFYNYLLWIIEHSPDWLIRLLYILEGKNPEKEAEKTRALLLGTLDDYDKEQK